MTAISEAQLIEAAERLRRLEDRIEDADILLAVRQESFRQRIADGDVTSGTRSAMRHIEDVRNSLDDAFDVVRSDMNAAHELIRRLQS